MKFRLRTIVSGVVFLFLAAFCAVSAWILYSSLTESIRLQFRGKTAGVGWVVSSCVDIDEIKKFMSIPKSELAKSALFMRYHAPLEKTVADTGITYLYLFCYGGDKDIKYLLDAYPIDNELFEAPGAEEDSVDEDLKDGLLSAFRGVGNTTPIFKTGEWGYMTSSTYPILNGGKRSFYMTGIDVKLDKIVARVAFALTKMGIVFLLISAFAMLAVSAFSRKIEKSVIDVKNGILKTAANGGGLETRNVPPELKPLVKAVGDYSANARAELESVAETGLELSRKVFSAGLASRLKLCGANFSEAESTDGKFRCFAFLKKGKTTAFCAQNFESESENRLAEFATGKFLEDNKSIEDIAFVFHSAATFDKNGKLGFSFGEPVEFESDKNGAYLKFHCGTRLAAPYETASELEKNETERNQ